MTKMCRDLMKPCCLKILQEDVIEDECDTSHRLGGATGWTAGECPKDADEADKIIKKSNDV